MIANNVWVSFEKKTRETNMLRKERPQLPIFSFKSQNNPVLLSPSSLYKFGYISNKLKINSMIFCKLLLNNVLCVKCYKNTFWLFLTVCCMSMHMQVYVLDTLEADKGIWSTSCRSRSVLITCKHPLPTSAYLTSSSTTSIRCNISGQLPTSGYIYLFKINLKAKHSQI